MTVDPKIRLGNDFKDIRNHPFFSGTEWNNLLLQNPFFEFESESEIENEGKEIMEKSESSHSTNPGLKLVRKDILIEETKQLFLEKIRPS